MNKTLLVLLITPAFAACTTNGVFDAGEFASKACDGSAKGKTDTRVEYGQSLGRDFIRMKGKSSVGRDAEFRIVLKPRKGLENRTVTIVGKSGKTPGGKDAPYGWMNASGTKAGLRDGAIVLCVPGNAPIGTEYKFDVEIDDFGTLDPRAEVTF